VTNGFTQAVQTDQIMSPRMWSME